MMPTCREVTRALAADALESASLFQRISVRFHLFFCVHCSDYARQLAAIGSAARRLHVPSRRGSGGLGELEKALAKKLSAIPPTTSRDSPKER